MTTVTLFLECGFQQFVGELTDGAEGLYALVITVAGDTILFNQLLVEGNVFSLPGNIHSLGGLQTDLLHLVTGDTLVGATADERCVAGETFAYEYR